MTDNPRLEFHMQNWARYQRTGGKVQTFPKRVPGFTGAGPHFDDMADDADLAAARTVDAIIRDLEPVEQCAIHHTYLDAVWRFKDDSYEKVLEAAKEKILRGINRWGLA